MNIKKPILIALLLILLFSCNDNKYTENHIAQLKSKYAYNAKETKKILTSSYTAFGDTISNGVKTILNLKKLREYFIPKLLKETSYSTVNELLENKPLKLFNKTNYDLSRFIKYRNRLIKYSCIIFNKYTNLELLLKENIDSISIKEALNYQRGTIFQTLEQTTKKELISNSTDDLYQTLFFIEKFHSNLINYIIELNSLEKSIYSSSLPEKITPLIKSFSQDSLKIAFNIDNEMNTKNLTLRWSNDPDLKTSKLYVGKSLIVSKENDSIYGYLRFYYSDKVYWKEWKTTVKKGLCVNQ